MANAPFAVGTPLLAGWLADVWGYQPAFVISAVAGALSTLCFVFCVPNPRERAMQGIKGITSVTGQHASTAAPACTAAMGLHHGLMAPQAVA